MEIILPEVKDYLKKRLCCVKRIIPHELSLHISCKQVNFFFFIDYITTIWKTCKTEKIKALFD